MIGATYSNEHLFRFVGNNKYDYGNPWEIEVMALRRVAARVRQTSHVSAVCETGPGCERCG